MTRRVVHQRASFRRVPHDSHCTMPKRKDIVDSDEDEAVETGDDYEEPKPKRKVRSTSAHNSKPSHSGVQVTAKKPVIRDDSDDDEEEEEERPIKKKKKEAPVSTTIFICEYLKLNASPEEFLIHRRGW